jgi:hypothetical protein
MNGCRSSSKGAAPVPLHATSMRLRLYPLKNRARVVPRKRCWKAFGPDAVVSDMALSTALKEVRHALRDDVPKQRGSEPSGAGLSPSA